MNVHSERMNLEAALRDAIPQVNVMTTVPGFGVTFNEAAIIIKLSVKVGAVVELTEQEIVSNSPEQWADWLLSRKVDMIDRLRQAAQELELSL